MNSVVKVLVLGASGFLGGQIFRALQKEPQVEVTGTYCHSGSADLKQLEVTRGQAFAELYQSEKPSVVIWSLMSGDKEAELIRMGLPHVLQTIEPATRLIYLSTDGVFADGLGDYLETDLPSRMRVDTPLANYSNAKLHGEELIQKHPRHVILRTGPIYGRDVNGRWDKRMAQLQEELTAGRKIVRATEAKEKGLPLDTSLDTSKARSVLRTVFREVE